ncbi:MAG: GGDEF domain-containing protein [Lachnospiraceae bacterium]|nr:GGDEF domain-containing protein [Lachnospiraceae bacterium]
MDNLNGQTERHHRIAVITNAWSSEFLNMALEGVRLEAEKDCTDIFVFVTFNLSGGTLGDRQAQQHIFDLIHPNDYDGMLLFSNTLTSPEEHKRVRALVEEADIPIISTEVRVPGTAFVGTSNYQGIYDLACHLIEQHGVKRVVFVSGYEGNEESNIRKGALEDALKDHGLTLMDVMPGDFGFYRSSLEMNQWIEEKKPIPDAFVCANDHMAMAIVSSLRNHGIDVPRDVIVTGYDQIYEAQVSYPIIATVAREWQEMGAMAYLELVRQIGDPDPTYERIFGSRFVPSESCGCEPDEAAREFRLDKMRKHYAESNETNMVDFFFQEMRVAMAQADSKERFHEIADDTLGRRHFFGNDYCLCTEPPFLDLDDEEELMKNTGFSASMDVLYERKNGSSAPLRTFDTRELYPGYAWEPGRSNVYIFAPMNSSSQLIGYLALKNFTDILYDLRFKRWLNNMDALLVTTRQYMIAQRANSKLREIYMNDFLTDMYNRTGCEKVLFRRIIDEKAAGNEMLMLFADINCMKVINDEYGHLNGDLAIQVTARALRKAAPANWLFGRYGGDEFIAVGRIGSDRTIDYYRERFSDELTRIITRLKISFPLSASLGFCYIRQGDASTIADYINMADASMYEEKERAHKEMEKLKKKS